MKMCPNLLERGLYLESDAVIFARVIKQIIIVPIRLCSLVRFAGGAESSSSTTMCYRSEIGIKYL